jgi:PD-(D/E)XK nuclease superfamily protein
MNYRVDLLLENLVIVEVKSHASTLPIHEAQVITYLKLVTLGCREVTTKDDPQLPPFSPCEILRLPRVNDFPVDPVCVIGRPPRQ